MDNNNFSLNSGGNHPQQTTNPAPSNPYSNVSPNNGTENAGVYNSNSTGTYNANPSGMYDATQQAYNSNTGSTVPAGFEEEYGKKAKSGMIIGIICLVLNLIFCCIPFITDWVFSPGWLFILLEIAGIQNSVQGRKSEQKRGMATAGLVMNIVSVVWSVLLVVLVIVLKFMD